MAGKSELPKTARLTPTPRVPGLRVKSNRAHDGSLVDQTRRVPQFPLFIERRRSASREMRAAESRSLPDYFEVGFGARLQRGRLQEGFLCAGCK